MIIDMPPDADIFADDADVLVVPVNCQPGILGAGLALEFAGRFPGLRDVHRAAVRDGYLAIGHPWFVAIAARDRPPEPWIEGHPWLCLFPTKDHWRQPSKLEHVERGLAGMVAWLEAKRPPLGSIAVPALGCGLGGLSYAAVRPRIAAHAARLPDGVAWRLYPPRPADRPGPRRNAL